MYKIVEGKGYIRFSNSDGKSWVVPIKGMRTALNLYQPSGFKGKLVKLLLPYLYWFPIVRRLIKAESVDVEIDSVVGAILDVDGFECAIFEGTPSVHRKSTIQIFDGDKILAYCKVSDNEEVVELFHREKRMLDYLHSVGVDSVPRCLFCDKIGDETLFVQSTTKTNSSKIVHEWSDKHWQFLEELHSRTKINIAFEQSDFAQSLSVLESYLDSIQESDRELITKAISKTREYYRGEQEFSVYHGDFTPWNTYVERGELFVFDLEYAGRSYPPYLDYFHFMTQTALFERGLSADEIYEVYAKQNIPNSEVLYRSYLLDIISKYVDREGGELSSATLEMLSLWCKILKRL